MKVDIQFTKNADVDAPCCAKTEVMGQDMLAIGRTWEEAETRLMGKVESWLNASVPAPKSVEVACKNEEMDTELLPWEDAPSPDIFNAEEGWIITDQGTGDKLGGPYATSGEAQAAARDYTAKHSKGRTIEAGKV